MLQTFQWADRIGIPATFFEAVPEKGLEYVGMLTLWRYPAFKQQVQWCQAVDAWAKSASTRGWFWKQLRQKKMGLYGSGISTEADPINLVRHPWAFRAQEFDDIYKVIKRDGVVPSVPDDRSRFTAIVGLVSTGVGAGVGMAVAAGATAPALPIIIAASGAVGFTGLLADKREQLEDDRKKAHVEANIAQYQAIYDREAGYRGLEVVS